MVKRISSGSPFEKKIGYSRAVVDGDIVYVSGTTGYDYSTMTMPADAAAQARNALGTIGRASRAGSSSRTSSAFTTTSPTWPTTTRWSPSPAKPSATSAPPPR